jgi:hypothetical protein
MHYIVTMNGDGLTLLAGEADEAKARTQAEEEAIRLDKEVVLLKVLGTAVPKVVANWTE